MLDHPNTHPTQNTSARGMAEAFAEIANTDGTAGGLSPRYMVRVTGSIEKSSSENPNV